MLIQRSSSYLVCLFLFLSVGASVCVSVSISLSVGASVCVCVSVCLSVGASVCLSLTLSLSASVCLCLYLSLSGSVCRCVCLVCLSRALSVSVSVCLSVCRCVCLSAAAMALISLEDLDGLDDEQMAEDTTDDSEAREDLEGQRLLNHWQSVGRTHQVSVPTGGGLSHSPAHHTEITVAWATFWISGK